MCVDYFTELKVDCISGLASEKGRKIINSLVFNNHNNNKKASAGLPRTALGDLLHNLLRHLRRRYLKADTAA